MSLPLLALSLSDTEIKAIKDRATKVLADNDGNYQRAIQTIGECSLSSALNARQKAYCNFAIFYLRAFVSESKRKRSTKNEVNKGADAQPAA